MKTINKTKLVKSGAGFTLIELLVVIAVIGLLASVVLVALNQTRVKARDTKRVADLKQINTALALYYDENGYYPPSSCGYDCNGYSTSYNITDWNTLASALSPYMAKLPVDPLNSGGCPPWTNGCYTYAYGNVGKTTQREQYDLTAQLEETNSPLRCGAKSYGFYFDNQPWCGVYSSQIYEASPN